MKPNIVVFMTDQQSVRGTTLAKTPNFDEFFHNSVKFTNAFCPSPHCCPSRASFFSGLMPSQHGVWNNVEVDNALSHDLFEGVTLFPKVLSDNGYKTIFSGKWHVSGVKGPEEHGFDKVLHEITTNYGRSNYDSYIQRYNDWTELYCKNELIDNGNEEKMSGRIIKEGYPHFEIFGIDENPFGDKISVEKACYELKNYKDEDPFFLYVGPIGPHDPYKVPSEFLKLYENENISLPENFEDEMVDKPALYRRTREQFALSKEEHIETLRHYLAFISYEDFLFGKLIDTLKEQNLYENTIIIFTTDHGDYAGSHGLWAKGLPCFKEAYNIVAAIGGKGITPNIVDDFVSITDFAPTILELAEVENPIIMSGKSLVPYLKNEVPVDKREFICTQTNGNEVYGIQRAVFDKKWKYVYNSFDYDELYDLENDPLEMKNIASNPENSEIIKEMCKKMWQFAFDTKDNCTCGYIMVRLAPYGPGIIFE